MRINKIFLLTLLLLAILTVGFVSAAEDNLTISEDLNLKSAEVEPIATDNATAVVADEDEGTYIDPTEAYQYLNEFRTSKGVWFWDSDNENVIYYNTNENNQLQPLEIDKGLEEVAKIRAKEIVINFEHERPDGSSIQPLYENYTGYDYFGENIAFSYFTGWEVTEAWKESSLLHDGQGHRRTMLNPNLNCVGIAGYIEPGGCPFWVQAFGFNGVPSQSPETIINYDNSKGSFADLYNQILNGNSLRLDKDYEYKNESIYANGITIDKAFTIDGCGHTIDAKKLARIFNITAQGVILKNVKFTNAYLDYANGGAIHTSGDLTLINCSFSDCFAYYGSAVYSTASSLTLTDCSFNDNFEVRGAVFKQTGNVSVENSNFKNNLAIIHGGALYIDDAYVTINNSIFKNNSAYLRGGAIFSARSNVSMTKSGFTSNVLDAGGPSYGAVFCAEDSDVLIKDCTFSKNRMNSLFRQAFGGAIYLIDGNVSVIDCNFTDNFAMEYGGAVFLVNNNASFVNCNFIGNSVYKGSYASSAGAIYATGGNISISQTLFSNNTAENGASIALDETEASINKCSFLNNPGGSNGAAVFSNNVNLTIDECNFFNNTCKYNGGAVYLRDGRISLINSVFSKGIAAYGGFLRLENANISIINDTFTEGITKNQYYSHGGAMYITNCQGSVEQSEFANNAVYSDEFTTMGGAVRCEKSDISFKGCAFTDNLADNGAAISSQDDNLSISNSNFKNNTAKNNGGALESSVCNISISNSEFEDDHSFDGGAIYSYGGSLEVRESRFINNSAFWGGAIHAAYSDATVYDSNFTGNVANNDGGALYTCNAVNSIFKQNKANTAAAIYGENNNATGCTFMDNVAYSENPTYGVNTIDCTFINNRIIIKAIMDIPYSGEYYQGNKLYAYLNAYEYPYQSIDNATVTVKIYKNNNLVNTFYFESADNGWTVNITEGEYFAVLSVDSEDFEVDPVNITFKVLKKEIATLNIDFKNCTYPNPVIVDIESSADANGEIYIDDRYIDYVELAGNVAKQLTYYNVDAGSHDLKVILTPVNSNIDSVTVSRNFTVFKKVTSVSLDVKDATTIENVVVSIIASESGWVSVKVGDDIRSVFVTANESSLIDFGALDAGDYVVEATFDASDENYLSSSDFKNISVEKVIANVDVDVGDATFPDSVIVSIKSSVDANGEIYIDDGYIDYVELVGNVTKQLAYTVRAGSRDLKVILTPMNSRIDPVTVSRNFTVFKGVTSVLLDVKDATTIDNVVVSVIASESGFVSVKVGDVSQSVYVTANESTSIDLGALDAGDYVVEATFNASDENYLSSSDFKNISVEKVIASVDVDVGDATFPDSVIVSIKSSIKANGEIYIDGLSIDYVELTGNVTKQLTYHVDAGSHDLKVILTPMNSRINPVTVNRNFTVFKKGTSVSLDVKDATTRENVVVSVIASESGWVSVKVGDVNQSVYVTANKSASIDFGALDVGNYVVEATFNAGENYLDSHDSKTIKVTQKITQKDIEISQNSSENIVVNLPKDAAGTITLTINNKNYTYNVENGTANVELPELENGNYSYVITYSGDDKYTPFSTTGNLNANNTKPENKTTPMMNTTPFENGTATITLPTDATGTITLTINNNKYTFNVKNGSVNVKLPELENGDYLYLITYSGDKKYEPVNATGNVNINNTPVQTKTTPEMNVGAFENGTAKVNLPADATGTITLTINNNKYTFNVKNGTVNVKLPELENGDYLYLITYSGDDKYKPVNTTGNVNINNTKPENKTKPEIEIPEITGENTTITLPADATGTITLTINNKNYTYNVENGNVNVKLPELENGNYTYTITYSGDDKYDSFTITKDLKVNNTKQENKTTPVMNATPFENGTATITLPADATGTITLTINNKNYTYNVENGNVNVKLPELENGNYSYVITYSGDDKYTPFSTTGNLNVNNTKPENKTKPEIKIPDITGENAAITLPADATGTITLTINNKNYTYNINNGTANIKLPELENGNYTYTITYSGDDKYDSFTMTKDLKVNKTKPITYDPVIIAKNVTVTYNAGSYYTITVYGTDGKAAENVAVTVNVDGKFFKTLKTNPNGIAKFKVTQIPKTYKLSITALEKTKTATLNVKHLVTLKSVTVKKSAKKLTLQANLGKVNGKYLSKKQVTFKFNGKTYKVKTNNKGVAKATIKSTVLKKLKVGKKVTYQATYLKDTVKKTAKVKK